MKEKGRGVILILMEELPFEMPALNKGVRRTVFRLNIQRKPVSIIFRGQTVTARINEPSFKRKMELAGYDMTADLMCDIALEVGSNPPQSMKEKVKIGDITYLISDVQADLGNDCYVLTLENLTQ